MKRRWKAVVKEVDLDIKTALHLVKKRENIKLIHAMKKKSKTTTHDNMVTTNAKVLLEDGKILNLERTECSGYGKTLHDEKPLITKRRAEPDRPTHTQKAQPKKLTEEKSVETQHRWEDAENKNLLWLDEQLIGKKVKKIDLTVTSFYTPCPFCRKELLLRIEHFGGTLTVKSAKFVSPQGKRIPVEKGFQFDQFLLQKNQQ